MKLSKSVLAAAIALNILGGAMAPQKAEAGIIVMVAGAVTPDYYARRAVYSTGFVVLMVGLFTGSPLIAVLDTEANQNGLAAQLTAKYPVLAKVSPSVTTAIATEIKSAVKALSAANPSATTFNASLSKAKMLEIVDQADVKTQADLDALLQMVEQLTNIQFAS